MKHLTEPFKVLESFLLIVLFSVLQSSNQTIFIQLNKNQGKIQFNKCERLLTRTSMCVCVCVVGVLSVMYVR